MSPKQISTLHSIVQVLKNTGIDDPDDRRAIIQGGDLRAKVAGILENHPHLQEELAKSMGIGDNLIGHLHEVMEEDFQESTHLFYELIDFFYTHGKIEMNIYDIAGKSIRSFHAGDKQERIQDIHSLFLPSQEKNFINEKILLQTDTTEAHRMIENNGGKLCCKITTPSGTKPILSFGNKNTPKNEIIKIQKLLKKTGLLQRIREKLKHIQTKYTDHLTGLYNKQYIQNVLEKNTPYSVVFLDLDKFKEYNDTFGHNAGDILLKEIAEILQSSVRSNDKVCRNGGDEFIIFIDGCDAYKEIKKITERINEKVDIFNLSKQEFANQHHLNFSPLSITSGYSIWDMEGSLEDMIHKADKEMFRKKMENGGEGGLYRIINKVSKLSIEQQREIISGLFALNPELINAT